MQLTRSVQTEGDMGNPMRFQVSQVRPDIRIGLAGSEKILLIQPPAIGVQGDLGAFVQVVNMPDNFKPAVSVFGNLAPDKVKTSNPYIEQTCCRIFDECSDSSLCGGGYARYRNARS